MVLSFCLIIYVFVVFKMLLDIVFVKIYFVRCVCYGMIFEWWGMVGLCYVICLVSVFGIVVSLKVIMLRGLGYCIV